MYVETTEGLFGIGLYYLFWSNEAKMKRGKGIGIMIILMPFILIAAVILYEMVGMCVNHAATDRQTNGLQADLTENIPDITILEINSVTGNASGTGNHVECMSTITFSTKMTENEIKEAMSEYFASDNKYCMIKKEEESCYSFYVETSAPFPDNIEGH